MAAPRQIPQRELRNRISEVLREVEAGAELRITVHGRPVADLVPVRDPQTFLPWERVAQLLRETPVDDDFGKDVDDALAERIDVLRDPWG